MPIIVTAYIARTNAVLIQAAAELYIKDGQTVADVTYGIGTFWNLTDCRRFKLLKSDLHPRRRGVKSMDFRKLIYDSQSIDHFILDPPYIHNPGQHLMNDRYYNKETTKGFYHADIMKLYTAGIKEASRVLRPEGYLWVKCKDQVESGQQRWSTMELFQIAVSFGFDADDLFVLVGQAPNALRWKNKQIHARKNHSFLWIFKLK